MKLLQNETRLYVKGAIEQVLRLSKRYLHHGSSAQLTDEKNREFIMDSNQMAARGLRSINIILIDVRDTHSGILYGLKNFLISLCNRKHTIPFY